MYVFFDFLKRQVAHLFTCTLFAGFCLTPQKSDFHSRNDRQQPCWWWPLVLKVRNWVYSLKIGNSAQIFHLQECHWHKKEVEFQWGRSFPTEHLGKEKKKWLVRETSENDKMIQHLQVGDMIFIISSFHYINYPLSWCFHSNLRQLAYRRWRWRWRWWRWWIGAATTKPEATKQASPLAKALRLTGWLTWFFRSIF